MKNIFLILTIVFLGLIVVMKVTTWDNVEVEQSTSMSIWSYSEELTDIANNYYAKQFPDRTFTYSEIPMATYPVKIDLPLMSKASEPDVFTLEDSFVGRYTTSGLLLDITDIYNEVKDESTMYPLSVGMFMGKCYALSWQVCPGAFFYRRSLAKKYLGSDNPDDVQRYLNDMNAFMQTAAVLKEKSGGSCAITASYADLYRPYETLRNEHWEGPDGVIVDKAMSEYLETASTMRTNEYDAGIMPGSDEWFAAMNGSISREDGRSVDVFGYFIPVWSYNKWLKKSAVTTAGDWAMVTGPIPYRWGGTWLAINANARYMQDARNFVRYVMSDKDFLTRWSIASGDIVANTAVQKAVAEANPEQFNDPFLGGQNVYNKFASIANEISNTEIKCGHGIIDPIWQELVNTCINEKLSKAESRELIKQRIKADFDADVTFR